MTGDAALHSRRGFLALPGALLLASCALLEQRWTYRYRLIVKVRQNGRIYEGSSVVEVRRTGFRLTKIFSNISCNYAGEGAAITLGSGQTIFTLLRENGYSDMWPCSVPHKVFAKYLGTPSMTDKAALNKLVDLTNIEEILAPDVYPMFVYFPNHKKPASIAKIDPAAMPLDLGTNTEIVQVSIRATKNPLEYKIERIIPSISQYKDKSFHGKNLTRVVAPELIPSRMSYGSFIIEDHH